MSDSLRSKAAAVLRQSRANQPDREALAPPEFGGENLVEGPVEVRRLCFTIDEATEKKFWHARVRMRNLLAGMPDDEGLKET